jgi:hypothetical protein
VTSIGASDLITGNPGLRFACATLLPSHVFQSDRDGAANQVTLPGS